MRNNAWFVGCLILAIALLALVTLAGCGGGGSSAGGVAGYLYQPIGGGAVVDSASATPPAGYEPVVGAEVSIVGHPDLTATTSADGQYYILGIPVGVVTLQATVNGNVVYQHQLAISCGEITWGGGHSEGGGGNQGGNSQD